ncbi:MAG TPA: hypothetical protein VFT04_10770 [Gemmatimonadales bacterium]|nr:hypothetical protein [Gemmatimonadales bacterium]
MKLSLNRYVVLAAFLAACGTEPEDPPDNGGGNPPPPPPPPAGSCAAATNITLQPGQHAVLNPSDGGGCILIPAAGSGGAEYVYAAVATNGTESALGSSVGYRLTGSAVLSANEVATATAQLPPQLDPALDAFTRPKTREAFHGMLRARERALAGASGGILMNLGSAGTSAVIPPTVGHERTFKVCETTSCSDFVDVPATARYVGPKGAIYVDNTVPAGGYTQADLNQVGFLFDNYLYPIDTAAFGRESDLDNNGVVVVLLTDQVNALSGNCNAEGSVILGYFYGSDLLPGQEGSNAGEVFYGLVPDPNNAECTISLTYAQEYLAPTFIHEFQHMISFNQHVLIRNGASEDTWLNEGLSHFAEELGGRAIPDEHCSGDCFTQFVVGDAGNAYRYLRDVEAHFLIEPGSSGGTLEERGANWLFVRWLADHFGVDQNTLTRALVGTNRLGAANVAAVAGTPFATLVPEWQLANYLDNLPGFTPANPRLQYDSWNFRATFEAFNAQAPGTFPRPYPLVPDSTLTGAYSRQGTLRAGSGRHLRVVQGSFADPVTLHLTDASSQTIGTSSAAPRIAIARIR